MDRETERLDLDDLRLWATAVRTHEEWIRSNASRYEIDASKYILGYVLETIIGDDARCFGGLWNIRYDRQIAEMGKELLLIRLQWEIDVPELPANIRQRLEGFKGEADEADWASEDGFSAIKEGWKTKVKDYVEEQVDSNSARY